MIIKAKIDVKKIDKSKLYIGDKGTYLDVTLLENRDGVDQYGNSFMIVQDVPKADREAGIKGAILGNAKILETNQKRASNPTDKPAADSASDDCPF